MFELIICYVVFVVLVVLGVSLGMHISDQRDEDMKEYAFKMGTASYYECKEDWEKEEDQSDIRN